jgi:alkylation response protein AidB-like acyl-CoA dehydrogenase
MTQDVLEIRGLAREFAAAELRPHAERWDAERALDADVAAKLAELGFFGMLVPEADGGMGFDLATGLAALEELAWGEAAAALLVAESIAAADLLARYGDDGLRAAWLPRLASGEALACIADAGDDASLPSAQRADGGWSLSGRAAVVPGGEQAALAIVLADDPDGRALFAVPRDAGVRIGERAATLGLRPLPFVELLLDGVRLEDSARLSAPDEQAVDAAPEHPVGELCVAAIAVGIAQAALDHAVAYANQREQFGRPIRMFEGLQFRMAEMTAGLYAARALVERAAAEPDDRLRVAVAKLVAGEAAMRVTTDAVQIFGGYGYMRDYPVEKLMRDAKAMAILFGTSDVQRRRIAAALYAD